MKLKEFLDLMFDETWVKVVDNETNGDYEELFVWAADWIGGDKATLARLKPLLGREVEDVTSCIDCPTEGDDDAAMVVVNLVSRESPKQPYRVVVEKTVERVYEVDAISQAEAEKAAVKYAVAGIIAPGTPPDKHSGWIARCDMTIPLQGGKQ